MAIQRACDRCSFMKNGRVRRYVLSRAKNSDPGPASRYSLSTRERTPSGTIRSYGAGSIDLCDDCWDQIARPRMRPQRVTRKNLMRPPV